MTKTKSELISEIMKLTGNNPEYFDRLEDKTEEYLTKLLKLIHAL